LLDYEGHPVYKNAELYLHPLEVEYWQDDKKLRQASERAQRNFAQIRRTLEAYARNLKFVDGNEAVEGISPLWLPGHTPGHTGLRERSLLIWGGIVHFPPMQSAQPGVSIVFDCDPVQAEITRKNLWNRSPGKSCLLQACTSG